MILYKVLNEQENILFLTSLISPYKNNVFFKYFDNVNWEEVIAIANKYYLIPLVYKSLKRYKLYETLQDKQLQEYLKEIYLLNKKRNKKILLQVQEIATILEEISVTPIFFKGSAALLENHYETLGERVMTDIDFYVEPNKINDVIDLLKNHCYKEIEEDKILEENWHHYRPMYKEGSIAPIEVHRYFLSERSRKYFFATSEIQYKEINSFQNVAVLQPDYELYLSFLHSELSHRNHQYKSLALRHLQHAAVILHKYKNEIDLKKLALHSERKLLQNVWYDYVRIQKYYFMVDILDIKESTKHLRDIEERLQKEKKVMLYIKMFFRVLKTAYSLRVLQVKYNFRGRILYPFFVLKHSFYLVNKYTIQKNDSLRRLLEKK